MPHKGKKKTAPAPPEIHPHVLRRREADRMKAEKQYARSLKKLKKRRRNNETAVASSNSEANILGSFRYGTNGEENEMQANINLPGSSRNESSASEAGKLQVKQRACISKINKTGKDTAAVQNKSLAESQSEVSKIPKASDPGRNVAEIGLDQSKGVSILSSGDKKVPKNSSQIQTTTRGKISIAKISEKESPKSQQPIKSVKCKIDSSKEDPKNSHKLLDGLRKKEKIEMKLQALVTEPKCLDETDENVLPITRFKEPEMALIGDIKIRKSSREKNEKRETFAYYDTDKRILHIGDEDVEIFIVVHQGEQVVCKSNRFNAESVSPRPKCQAMVNLEKDHHGASTTDTKCTSSNIYDSSNKEYQTLENQTSVRSEEDEKHDLEQQVEAIVDAKGIATSVDKHSEENSELSFIQENDECESDDFCDEFLMHLIATFDTFEASVIECIAKLPKLK